MECFFFGYFKVNTLSFYILKHINKLFYSKNVKLNLFYYFSILFYLYYNINLFVSLVILLVRSDRIIHLFIHCYFFFFIYEFKRNLYTLKASNLIEMFVCMYLLLLILLIYYLTTNTKNNNKNTI